MKISAIAAVVALSGLAYTPLQAGDAGAGANTYNARGCLACHGPAGKKPLIPTYPVIGGKPAEFVAGELNKFRSGERKNPIMGPMAAGLSDGDVADLAAYLATQ